VGVKECSQFCPEPSSVFKYVKEDEVLMICSRFYLSYSLFNGNILKKNKKSNKQNV
jgi:hypothetical protein